MKRHIILVDDEEMSREEFSRIFKDTEFKLDFATNSREGVEKIRNFNYEAVLLDMIMPNMSGEQSRKAGLELLRLLKKEQPSLPIIMVTVLAKPPTVVEAMRLGAEDYITKDTIEADELIKKVRKAIERCHDRDLPKSESERTEFKSSLRWNLKANKLDKDIEIACMKAVSAFLNSEGGTLFIGIDDQGNIIGVEQDRFPSLDRFQLHFGSLIKKYIGINNANLINCHFRKVGGKDIFCVDCQKSKEPVFLKVENKEELFYVRIGASSRRLNMSEAMSYIKRMGSEK